MLWRRLEVFFLSKHRAGLLFLVRVPLYVKQERFMWRSFLQVWLYNAYRRRLNALKWMFSLSKSWEKIWI